MKVFDRRERFDQDPPLIKLAINGKFLEATAGRSGVYRVAYELLNALDKLLSNDPVFAATTRCCVVVSKKVELDFELKNIALCKTDLFGAELKGNIWEQLVLPWKVKGHILLNLCNVGPVLRRNAYTMMHDAQVRAFPESYSRAFRYWYQFAQPLLAKINKGVLTVSYYSRNELTRYKIAPTERIHVIHNGCDHVLRIQPNVEVVKRFNLLRNQYVVALSNTQAHKNIGVLFKAFNLEAMRKHTLVLFGAANRVDFERLGYIVPSNVKFIGKITDEELYGLLIDATALAFPSLTEGFGLPPLEAMVLGCPVVIAPCGALSEVCGDSALIADPNDANEWAAQLARLYKDPEYAAYVGEAGRAHAKSFTWEKAAKQLLILIATDARIGESLKN